MDKQTTIAFILIGAVFVLWLYLSTPEPVKQVPSKQDSSLVKKENKIIPPVIEETDSVNNPGQQSDSLKFGKYFTIQPKQEKIITIESDDLLLEFSTKGGNLRKAYLKKFNNWYSIKDSSSDIYKTKVQLINYTRGGTYDLAFVSADGKVINTSSLDFSTDADKSYYRVSGKDSLQINFQLNLSSGKFINKKFTFYGDKYNIGNDIELSGMNSLISNNSYDLVWSHGINFVEENSVDEANQSNASLYYGDEHVIVKASDIGKQIEKGFNGKVEWAAIRDKYFTIIIVPQNPLEVEEAYFKGTRISREDGLKEYYDVRLTVPFRNNQYEKRSFNLYLGPVNYDILKTYNSHMEKIVEFGSFFGLKFIIRPIAEYVLLPLFNFLHSFIPNYGFVIILFSLIIKFVLYPLTKSSMQSMKKMQLLAPKINEIKEKFKDDPTKVQKETMNLYRIYGINPAGGCLPLLLQMPIFIAMWGLFQVAVELRQQPFMLWIHDLSRPDIVLALPFKLPMIGIDKISGLAVLMGITTFVQQKMTVKDPKQQAMIYLMPIFLTLMFMSFPSGLNLYYFMFNLFSIVQQYYVNNKHDGMELVPVANPKKSKGFMQKIMETAEQNAKAQQKRKK
ncbi:MAG: membrane protein insertase YidC [Ignavibacteriaceae bacterium]|nr:membrane protein insertase YidC [Ignavibacteriaceae bacterium]